MNVEESLQFIQMQVTINKYLPQSQRRKQPLYFMLTFIFFVSWTKLYVYSYFSTYLYIKSSKIGSDGQQHNKLLTYSIFKCSFHIKPHLNLVSNRNQRTSCPDWVYLPTGWTVSCSATLGLKYPNMSVAVNIVLRPLDLVDRLSDQWTVNVTVWLDVLLVKQNGLFYLIICLVEIVNLVNLVSCAMKKSSSI